MTRMDRYAHWVANIARDPFYWVPEYIDRIRIVKLRDNKHWRRERVTAFKLAFTAGYIAGFLDGGRAMKPRAVKTIAPLARGCVSNGVIANATGAIDNLLIAGPADNLPVWGR